MTLNEDIIFEGKRKKEVNKYIKVDAQIHSLKGSLAQYILSCVDPTLICRSQRSSVACGQYFSIDYWDRFNRKGTQWRLQTHWEWEKKCKNAVNTVLISSILRRHKHQLRKKSIEINKCCHKQFFSIKVISGKIIYTKIVYIQVFKVPEHWKVILCNFK